jgi:hypothetical protein
VIAGHPTFAYVSLRQLVYTNLEPVWNTAAHGFTDPHGSTHGPFTLESDPNALHAMGSQFNGGSYFCGQAILTAVTIGP